ALAEQQDAVAKQHQRGDRLNLRGAGELLLRFGVDLAEHDVAVRLRSFLEHRRERTARAAPFGPEIEQDDAALLDRLLEVVCRDLDGRHRHTMARLPDRRKPRARFRAWRRSASATTHPSS